MYPESQSLPRGVVVNKCPESHSMTKEVSKSTHSPSNCQSMSELVFKVPVTAIRGQYYYPESQSLPLNIILSNERPCHRHYSSVLVSRIPVIVTKRQFLYPESGS